MAGNDDELIQLRLSTKPFARDGQLDAFREVWGRKMLRYEIEPLGDHPLEFDALVRSLPDFVIASACRSPMRNQRSQEHIDHDDFFLVVVARGAAELSEGGRFAAVRDGEAVLSSNETPANLLIPMPSRTISYRLRRNLLRSHVHNIDDLVARPVASDNQVLRLLVGYSNLLNDQSALATTELRRAVSAQMHELAALLFGARPEPHLADGFRAARLKALKDDILRKITHGDLSVAEIARSQQISERYMRKLFATEETTFTDFVRDARLARAHQLLTDPRQFNRPINAIAYESGFGDLSYFNRVFRQRYNMTPSDARGLARREQGAEG